MQQSPVLPLLLGLLQGLAVALHGWVQLYGRLLPFGCR